MTRRTFASLPAALGAAPARPNIIWIWADNLAYGDLACYGNTAVKTPAIDGLAAQGVRFTQFYVAHTVCSPSRAALLTGRQPFPCGIVDVLRPDSPTGLPESEVTIAAALRKSGYRTQAIGKWHLGDRPQYLPTARGFDHYFGLPYSMDMAPTLLYRDTAIIGNMDGAKVESYTRRLTDEAIRFVETSHKRPFFLYFAHTLPHPPVNLPADARKPGRRIYDDAIEHLDAEVGRLLESVDRLGLRDNTLAVFTSDNGPMHPDGNNGGLRGRIRDAYEGGLRVPFIARWPARIPASRVVHDAAIMYDAFPTLSRLCGAKLPNDRVFDGQDIWPLLSGEGAVRREKPFVWVYTDNVTTVREGRWKLHLAHRDKPLPAPELYDLETDPRESRNLASEQPDQLRRLNEIAAKAQAEVPKAWPLYYPVLDPKKLPSGPRRR
jgi:arylsulfatase A-like enzyme